MYKVFHQLVDLGWVDLDSRCSAILPRGLSDKIGLLKRPKKRSTLRPILRESVFPEDLIGSKIFFKDLFICKMCLKEDLF